MTRAPVTIGALAAMLLTLGAAAVRAQDLPSKPLSWLAALPVPVPSPVAIPGAETGRRPFLKGRFMVGANLTHSLTPDEDLGSHWSVSPVIRNTPRRLGWGPSFGLSGYKGDIVAPVNGQKTTIGEIRIRPLMGGISYSIGESPLRTSFSLVGGYAFASATITAALPSGTAASIDITAALPSGTAASIDITNAWVVRPNVGLTYALTRRLAIIGSVGYVYTNPTIIITVNQQDQGPRRLSGTFRSDYVSITVGTAVSIF